MRLKSFIAMTGAVLAGVAIFCTPVHAQQQKRDPRGAGVRELSRRPVAGDRPLGARREERCAGSMCQACHGSAAEHLKDPTKAKPANPFGPGHTADERTGVCLTCHSGNRNLAFWTSGKHQLNEITCANCHSIHGERLLPSLQPEQPTAEIGHDQQVHDDVPEQPGRDLLAVPSADPGGELQAVASPDHRRQGQVYRLPQPARRDHAGDAEAADDQRPVLLVPRRQARSVRLQPPAGRGELHHLPQPPRLGPCAGC